MSVWRISVKAISFVKSLICNWFHEIIFKWYKNLVNSTEWQCGKREIHCHTNFFLLNWFTVEVNFLSKPLIWRKTCEKTVALAVKCRNFDTVRNFHTVMQSRIQIFTLYWKISSNCTIGRAFFNWFDEKKLLNLFDRFFLW